MLDSSVSHRSDVVPTTWSAVSRLISIMRSMRSSSVPAQISLWTWTSLVWPMRKARSVAWFSTAGFHHRS